MTNNANLVNSTVRDSRKTVTLTSRGYVNCFLGEVG